ncbi:MAG: 23S rRNA (guanosine(2251)-2'-O)-methyltransferase RlmB [Bacteroidetes bacterium]|nr:23S rRNA (guanosine(2251)-2'-O)-methyltransferase RlmB [Bacteroidota bacterium]
MAQLLTGRKPVLEALKAGRPLERILLLRGTHGGTIEDIRKLADQRGVPIVASEKQHFRDFAPEALTQGVVAYAHDRALVDLDQILEEVRQSGATGFLLILDQIEDPQNLGALIRTAECAGTQGVIVPRHHSAPVTPAAVKASAGATEHILIAEVANIVNAIEQLKNEGFWIVGLASEGEKLYTELDYSVPTAIVVGNEGQGLRRLVREHCDHLVRIPLFGKVQSLNASVAAALSMFEVVRQREKL